MDSVRGDAIVISDRHKLKSSANFHFWYGMTLGFFKIRDVFDVATGNDKLDETKPKKEQIEWKKKDATVQNMITSSVDKKLLIHLIHCKSGAEMYDKMQTIFGRNEKETDDLMERFFKLGYETQTGGYKRYFSTLDRIVSKLRLRDVAITEDLIINKVLTSLPPCYEDFLTEWEGLDDEEKNYGELKKRLLVDDVWQKLMAEEQSQGKAKRCFLCGNPYHKPKYCLRMYANRKGGAHMENGHLSYRKFSFFQSAAARKKHAFPTIERPRCQICKKDNHATKSCYFRPQRMLRQNRDQSGVVSLSFDDEAGQFVVTASARCSQNPESDEDIFIF